MTPIMNMNFLPSVEGRWECKFNDPSFCSKETITRYSLKVVEYCRFVNSNIKWFNINALPPRYCGRGPIKVCMYRTCFAYPPAKMLTFFMSLTMIHTRSNICWSWYFKLIHLKCKLHNFIHFVLWRWWQKSSENLYTL